MRLSSFLVSTILTGCRVFLANMANRVPTYVPAYYEITSALARARDNPYFAG